MLRVERLCVSYGPVPALVDVDLEVGSGEVVALVGANGSGRTTLLRTVSGLLRPRSGRVLLDGDVLSGRAPAAVVARGVGHVPQGRRVFGRMTVRENLLVGAHLTSGRGDGRGAAAVPGAGRAGGTGGRDAVRRRAAAARPRPRPHGRAADRGVVLEAGRVVLAGPAADLLQDDGVRRAHLG